MDTWFRKLFIHLSYITTATQGDIFKHKSFLKIIKTFRDMRSICPKIFAKLDIFATMSQMVVAYSALKIS